MKHGKLKAVLVIIIGLLLGYMVATQLGGFLGIEFIAKDLPADVAPDAVTPSQEQASKETPLNPVAAIVLPPGALQDDLYVRAADALADAVAMRTSQRPQIVEAGSEQPAGRRIVVGAQTAPELASAKPESAESSTYMPFATASGQQSLGVVGGSRLGDAYGIYRLADEMLAGADDAALFSQQRTFEPAMRRRLVDLGGVGIPQDPARWDPTNYSHHLRAFEDVFLPEAPYIDPLKFAEVQAQFADYVQRMIAYGNNGIVMPGFLEFINFDKVGDGHAIYPADSEYRARHLALRAAYNQLIDYAHAMGMDVYLNTDMLALTPPLEAYLKEQFGGLDTGNPALWQVYGSGLEELVETMPGVSGLMIRIGEAGTIYNLPGWDYYSALAVRSVASAQAMLKVFADVAEKKDKSIIFRTWSVGVGEVGDMHTNPASYDKLLAGIDSPNLIVSTKLTGGDFYSDLPLNATLRSGDQQRIIEFQNRLEFEGSMAFPDYIAPLHQQAMQTLRAANPRIDGIWHWNQNGGPQQAGPMSLYPFYGFWLNIDANSYVTSRLGWEPDADIADLTSAWVRRTFGNDPQAVANLTEMLFLSRDAALKGLYISPFATQQVNALGLKTTPMMWIFEWDIVDGSNSVLSTVYLASRDRIDAAIAEGFDAVNTVHRMQALLANIDPTQVTQPELLKRLGDSLAYEANLFETLAWYRQAFLRYYQWLDTGDPTAARDWQQAFGQYEAQKTAHLARYEGDRSFPAYNFFSADIGMAHAQRAQAMAWLARLWLVIMALLLLAGSGPIARRSPNYPGKTGLRAVWLALTASTARHSLPPLRAADWLTGVVLPFGLIALCYLTFSSFLSLQYALLTLVMLGVFVVSLSLVNWRRTRPLQMQWLAALAASLLLPTALLTAVVAVRGPSFFWLNFWTNAAGRTLFVTLNVAAIAWMFFVLYAVQRASLGRSVLGALGNLSLAVGALFVALGLAPSLAGLEKTLTAINDEMAVLPLGLSRILGITTHLGIPPELPIYLMAIGALFLSFGGLLLGAAWLIRRTARG
jgi:hypothetical protein